MTQLILKRASASRPSGEWNDDDFDVLANGEVVGRIFKANAASVGSPWMWTLAFRLSPGSRAEPWVHGDARGRDGCICQELAAAMTAASRELKSLVRSSGFAGAIERLRWPRCMPRARCLPRRTRSRSGQG
jgi:hypothetical protein